jgi:hypothetical protein
VPVIISPEIIATTCSTTYEKMQDCLIYRCTKQGFCVLNVNIGLPIWADVLIDVFIVDPFGRFYTNEECIAVGTDDSCNRCDAKAQTENFKNRVKHRARNWRQYWRYPGVDPEDPAWRDIVRCTLRVSVWCYIPTADFPIYCGSVGDMPGIKIYHAVFLDPEDGEVPGPIVSVESNFNVGECNDCDVIGLYSDALWFNVCGRANNLGKTTIGFITKDRVCREYYKPGYYNQMRPYLIECGPGSDDNKVLLQCFIGRLFSAYLYEESRDYPLGSEIEPPDIPDNSCFHNASFYIFCDRIGGAGYTTIGPDDPRHPHPPPYRPPSGPDRPRFKEDQPKCMQPCTCEEVERIVAKYVNKSISGNSMLDSCSSRLVTWSGDGLQGINNGLEAIVSAINDLGKALCPELQGNFNLPDCQSGTASFDYRGKGIQGLSKQLEALAKGLRHTTVELCEARSDIMREVISIPNKVQIQLSDEFALIIAKLNQILSKLGDDDNIFSKILQVITFVATILGLINDIRQLLERQKDYTPDLELLKELTQEIKRLLSVNVQGSIDAIRCDGSITNNSWWGEGLEGLNQAITALGVNIAVLHSDICELLERKINEIKPPRLQGSVDAIMCDGTISSNSWDGEGFEGLNQAITAIGVNLAMLHSDLCQLINKQEEDQEEEELPLLEGSIDAIRCDGTIHRNSWRGRGFDGLNQAITAIGVNLAILHSDLCQLFNQQREDQPPLLEGSINIVKCDGTNNRNSWRGRGLEGLNQAITAIGSTLATLHSDLCETLKKKKKFQINDRYKCGDDQITVQQEIDSVIADELRFLYEHLKRIELLACKLDERVRSLDDCDGVPVFPGDSIEERNIPNQAVITLVESKYYPYLKGSKWHINIPYPKEDLISETGCWQKFANLTLEKGDVYGRLIWKSPNGTVNRFWTAIYGKSEDIVRQFLTRISQYSKLEVASIRISKGGNPRARPKNVRVQAVKVALLERDEQGILRVTKCCRAPKGRR